MSSPGPSPNTPEHPALEPTIAAPALSGTSGEEPPTTAYVEQAPTVNLGRPPRVFGSYELIREVGRGGMGVVYQARQKGLDRVVALKMILPGPLANPDDLARFRTEAEATARMQHPHIVTVHEVGEVDGQHFYSMDFIDGPSLNKRVAGGPLPGRTAARYVLTIARAVHHAHGHGIIHRDLKPSNILLDKDDQPHVTDFGLAKQLGGDSGQTRTGTVMGTPSYMAPEQAAGKVRELGPACDVYSLGAVLYELLTGRPPFRSETPLDTIKHVLEKDAAPPRLLNPKVDRDLETICLKCLEKDPRARYASAGALADDLARYLNGEAITARSFSVLDRLARALERSQHAAEFRSWGTMVLLFAAVIFLGHLATFLLIRSGQPILWHRLARGSEFVVLGLIFWRFRRRTVMPTSVAERQLWSIWIGYLLAFATMVVAVHFLTRQGVLTRGGAGPDGWQELILYPASAVLAGLAFFIMGSNFWGGCYTVGVVFFATAAVMPLVLPLAPLILGLTWSVTLTVIGLYIRRQAGGPGDEAGEGIKSREGVG